MGYRDPIKPSAIDRLMQKPVFRRQIIFEPGYNYLHEQGPSRRGQHGMEIGFLLHGPHGAVIFRLGTSWTPPGPVDEDKTWENGYHREPVHIDEWGLPFMGSRFGHVRPPTGMDLGHHWRTPLWDGMYEGVNCNYLGAKKCYYDGSGLQADDVLRKFIVEGQRPVWAALVERYRYCLDQMKEYADEHSVPSG